VTDRDEFLRAIADRPRDDTPRLAYADWLDENGRSEQAAFIRTEIDIYRRPEWDAERIRYIPAPHDPLLSQVPVHPWADEYRGGVPAKFLLGGLPRIRRGFPWCFRVTSKSLFLPEADPGGCRQPVERLEFIKPPDLRQLAASPWLARVAEIEFETGPYAGTDLTPFLNDPRAGGLEQLAFSYGSLTADGAAAVFGSAVAPNLTRLHFTYQNGKVGRAILNGLRTLPTPNRLRGFRLECGGLETHFLRMLAAQPLPPNLVNLSLSTNRLSADRVTDLIEGAALANVRVLDLSGNAIGNAGAAALAASPHLGELRVLSLDHCTVGDDGIRAILDSPLSERLVLLDLTGSPASAEMKQHVKDAMGDRVRI
jgi:uncharacterized protein (TIGR02996 family)